MGGARETALASSTYAPFTRRLLTFTGWNWKCHIIIVIKTDLSGFVVPMHSGLCEQYVKSCFARALVHWDNKPSRTGLNPLKKCHMELQDASPSCHRMGYEYVILLVFREIFLYCSKKIFLLQWCHVKVMVSQITTNSPLCSKVCLGKQQKCQSPALLAFCERNKLLLPSQRARNADFSLSWHLCDWIIESFHFLQ